MRRLLLLQTVIFMQILAPCAGASECQTSVAHKVLQNIKVNRASTETFSQITDQKLLLATKFLLILDSPHLARLQDLLDVVHQTPELRAVLCSRVGSLIKILRHSKPDTDTISDLIKQLDLLNYLSGREALDLLLILEQSGAAEYIVSEYVNEFWQQIKFNDVDWRNFIQRYSANMQEDSHIANIKRLILHKRFVLARDALRYLKNPIALRQIVQALDIIEQGKPLSRSLGDFEEVVLLVAPHIFKGVTLQSRYELLSRCAFTKEHGNLWWPHYKILVNDLLRHRRSSDAYHLISSNKFAFTKDIRFLQQMMAGWIACSAGYYQRAIIHFLEAESSTALHGNKAKVYYWLARAYAAMDNHDLAQGYYAQAATYPLSFYGQLAAEITGQNVHDLIRKKVQFCSACGLYKPNELNSIHFLVGLILEKGKAMKRAFYYFANSLKDGVTEGEKCYMLEYISKKFGSSHQVYDLGVKAANFGVAVTGTSYPSIKDMGSPLVWALIRQETRFRNGVVSPKNAQGLMQILDTTACSVANKLGVPYSSQRLLNDPQYNIFIGSAYLNTLLKQYSGNMMAAVASYNAGSSRVNFWLRDNPIVDRSDHLQVTHWLESVPYRETHDYVIRVLEAKTVYDALLRHSLISK